MRFDSAVSEVRQMLKDTGMHDEGIALHTVVRDLLHIAQTADGMVAVDAFAISMALARGEEDSEE